VRQRSSTQITEKLRKKVTRLGRRQVEPCPIFARAIRTPQVECLPVHLPWPDRLGMLQIDRDKAVIEPHVYAELPPDCPGVG
jgi:hypothetical protein